MLNYEKLSKTNRTMAAMLLLIMFMVLAVTDLFISFFGGAVLGVLLVQFALEVRMFFRRRSEIRGSVRFYPLIRSYESLPPNNRMLIRVALHALLVLLVLLGLLSTFWGGLVLGVLGTVVFNEVLMYRQQRRKAPVQKTNIQP
ncbi:hypothetical protein [Pontibacter actiniarum]|uniref:Uncharacterized protein n=1 Tax=Pontibacter actiniarum TaxID=323450 RepID=A0A1X9YXS4_9BACT|nr:hypothetical protein [Pontibacter actiniarum]ARS37613.1 hypothetical protein CA264_20485 [Pontibacter actiniarum]